MKRIVEIVGQYSRQAFIYVITAGQTDAGKQVYLQPLDEEDMQSFVIEEGRSGAQENWKRCAVTNQGLFWVINCSRFWSGGATKPGLG